MSRLFPDLGLWLCSSAGWPPLGTTPSTGFEPVIHLRQRCVLGRYTMRGYGEKFLDFEEVFAPVKLPRADVIGTQGRSRTVISLLCFRVSESRDGGNRTLDSASRTQCDTILLHPVMAPSPKGLTRETPQGRTEVWALPTSCSPYEQSSGLGTFRWLTACVS